MSSISNEPDEGTSFEVGLQRYLRKCELEYRAHNLPQGSCVSWLEDDCNTVEQIARCLHDLGFRIKDIVDDEPWPGEFHKWVVTTSGIIVYVNSDDLRGFIAKSHTPTQYEE